MAAWRRTLRIARKVDAPYKLRDVEAWNSLKQQVPSEESDAIFHVLLKELRGRLKSVPLGPDDMFIYKCLKVWLNIYQDYGFDFTRCDQKDALRAILQTAADVYRAPSWLKYFKYKNNALFAAVMGNPLPVRSWNSPLDQPHVLFGGPFYTYFMRMRRNDLYRISFSCSILMSKKGMPRPSKEMVAESIVSHMETMTTERASPEFCEIPVSKLNPDMPPSDFGWRFRRDFFKTNIRSFVHELFSSYEEPFSLKHILRPHLPSMSANVQDSVRKYGSWNTFNSSVRTGMFASVDTVEEALSPELNNFECWDIVSEYYGVSGLFDEICNTTSTKVGVDLPNLRPVYHRLYWNLYMAALNEQPKVRVVGLAEALKVRCISKGPPYKYFCMKPFQKYIWKVLRAHPFFQLIGEEVTPEFINDRFRKPPQGTSSYCSVDYETATDLLESWVSDYIADCIFDELETMLTFPIPGFRTMFKDCLTGHVYEPFSQNFGSKVYKHPGGKQRIGQLMGSVVSFVVLCIANGSLIDMSYCCSHGATSSHHIPAIINGDDAAILVQQPESFMECWRTFGTYMGLRESVGKTYVSSEFLTINSRFFWICEDGYWAQIPFINYGLIHGYKRSAELLGGNDNRNLFDLGQNYRALMFNAFPFHHRAHKQFMYYNHHYLSTYSGPWNLPIYLCGLGLGHEPPTREQLYKVSLLKQLYGRGTRVPTRTSDCKWNLDCEIERFLQSCNPLHFNHFLKRFEGDSTYDEAYTMIAYCLWAKRGISSLLKFHSRSSTRVEKMSSALWGRCSQYLQYYWANKTTPWFTGLEKADIREIEHEPKQTSRLLRMN